MSVNNFMQLLMKSKQPLTGYADSYTNTPIVVEQPKHKFDILTDDELREVVNVTSERSPFYGIIGQSNVVEQLCAALVSALRNESHTLVGGNAFLFTGPPSVGKTELAKRLAGKKGLDLPFVEVSAKQVKGTQDIFNLAMSVAKESGVPLIPLGISSGRTKYTLPPMTIFVDEIHGLAGNVMDDLLKALESNDCTLATKSVVVNCTDVLWIGATTELGSIVARKPAFASRFAEINFQNYSHQEMAEILELIFKWNSPEGCHDLAVRGGGILRQSISIGQAAVRQLSLMQLKSPNVNIVDAIDAVCQQRGVDENGITTLQWDLLMALFNESKGMTYSRLAFAVNRTEEEVKVTILPGLMISSETQKALVAQNSRFTITEGGLNALLEKGLIDQNEFNSRLSSL